MWGGWRKEEPPEVIAAKAATLGRGLERARSAGGELILLDTPGAAAAEALAATEAADLILIPCRPRAFDLGAIIQTAAVARASGKPAFLVFNATTTRPGAIRADAREVADSLKLPVAPVRLAERAAFHRATEEGRTAQEIEPEGKAAAEVAALWEWVCDRLSMTPKRLDTTEA
jgi:chromosome partitioning protein